jgi:hypothetical protein
MVLVDVVRRRRVGPWRSQIISRLILPPGSASIVDHRKAISRPGRGRDCPGEYEYIVAVRSVKWSTSDIRRENAPRFLLLVRMHTGLSARH